MARFTNDSNYDNYYNLSYDEKYNTAPNKIFKVHNEPTLNQTLLNNINNSRDAYNNNIEELESNFIKLNKVIGEGVFESCNKIKYFLDTVWLYNNIYDLYCFINYKNDSLESNIIKNTEDRYKLVNIFPETTE